MTDAQITKHPVESTRERILLRDKITSDLRAYFATHLDDARAAGEWIRRTLQRRIDRSNEAVRAEARRKLALLPIAHRWARDPARMESGSGQRIDPKAPPQNFSVYGLAEDQEVPNWAWEAYEALGRFNSEVTRELHNLKDWVRAAETGCYGEWTAESTVDLSITSTLDAYIFSQCVPLSHPTERSHARSSVEFMRQRMDPGAAVNTCATPWWALWSLSIELLKRRAGAPRSIEQWTRIAALVLVLQDPLFAPGTIGITSIPEWGGKGDFFRPAKGRCRVLEEAAGMMRLGGDHKPNRAIARFWLLAERSRNALVAGLEPAPPTPTGPDRHHPGCSYVRVQ